MEAREYALAVRQDSLGIENAILAWLDAKGQHSQSQKTLTVYRDVITNFRTALLASGIDLDCPNEYAITLAAQTWCRKPWETRVRRKRGDRVSNNTYNQRLAVLSSFYTYAHRAGVLRLDPSTGQHVPVGNPILLVERAKVQQYDKARALAVEDVAARIEAIDRDTVTGLRDYALLGVALVTGRRLAELAAMNVGDVTYTQVSTPAHRAAQVSALVVWPRAKGGKQMQDELPPPIAAALLAYLGERRYGPSDAPVWLNHSTYVSEKHGQRLSVQSIADIWARRLGTSKVHATRHTFAREMEARGAKVSDIQARLGHSNLATTGRYLAALNSAHNPLADTLAAAFGFSERTPAQ